MIYDEKLYLTKILTWISAFIIVLFHYALWFDLELYEKNEFIDYLIKRKTYGANFVYLYWALTGYFLISYYHTKKKIIRKQYIVDILARYYPLHILTLLVVFLIQYFNLITYGKTQFGYSNDFYHFVLHIFFASDWGLHTTQSFNAPIWFMSILIPILIYFLITFKILIKYPIFFSISTIIFFYIFVPKILNPNKSILNFQACFFYFYLGILIFYICELKNKHRKKFQNLGAFGIIVSLFALNYTGNFLNHQINLIPSTILLFSSFILFCQNYYIQYGNLSKKVDQFINTSYSIYLWHFPLQLIFIIIFKSLNLNFELFKNPFLFLFFLITLFLISFISLKKFEKPCEKFIKSFSFKLN